MKKAYLLALGIIAVVGLSIVAALPLFSRQASQQGGQQSTGGVELRVITRHDSTIYTAYGAAFLKSDLAKRFNVANVRFESPGPQFWLSLIRQEGRYDVAWGGGPTLFDQVADAGLLASLESDLVAKEASPVPDQIHGVRLKRLDAGKLTWVAAAISSFGIMVNTRTLQTYGLPGPKDWVDLARPEYASRLPVTTIAVAQASRSTSHTRIYQIILQAYGWERGWSLITRIAANARVMPGSVEAQIEVDAGNVAAGPAIDFYGYTSRIRTNGTVIYVIPQNTLINGDPIAVVKGTRNKQAAEAFVSYVLSLEGQALWLNKEVNRLPVREDVFDTPTGRGRSDLKEVFLAARQLIPIDFSDDKALKTERALQVYYDAALTDKLETLQETWKTLVQALLSGRISEAKFRELAELLGRPLTIKLGGQSVAFSDEYAASINSRLTSDRAFEADFSAAVRQAAEEHYGSVRARVGR